MLTFSLNIDDGAPVNLYCYHDFTHHHEKIIPASFVRKFGSVTRKYGARGKFSVVPVPACLGRLDEKICCLTPREQKSFIKAVHDHVMPDFSLTPEILTHFLAWNDKYKSVHHLCEDKFFSNLSTLEVAEYVSLALQILDNVGLTPDGVTSPWATGLDNEVNYAAGIGIAFRKVLNRDHCFYFLHCSDEVERPTLVYKSDKTGRVVTIPANTDDPFWGTQYPATAKQAVLNAKCGIDCLLSENGKRGRIRDLVEKGDPVVILSHWQSLFSEGRAIGLEGLNELLKRIEKVFGKEVEWKTFAEIEAETPTPV